MDNATRTPACHRVMAKVVVSMTETEYAVWRGQHRHYLTRRGTPIRTGAATRG